MAGRMRWLGAVAGLLGCAALVTGATAAEPLEYVAFELQSEQARPGVCLSFTGTLPRAAQGLARGLVGLPMPVEVGGEAGRGLCMHACGRAADGVGLVRLDRGGLAPPVGLDAAGREAEARGGGVDGMLDAAGLRALGLHDGADGGTASPCGACQIRQVSFPERRSWSGFREIKVQLLCAAAHSGLMPASLIAWPHAPS